MSYYRYITGLYKSYWPELNRTLRSSSVPRTVPDTTPGRYVRGTSMPPSTYFTDSPSTHVTNSYYSTRSCNTGYTRATSQGYTGYSRATSASPFLDRALSVPPQALSVPTRNFVSDSHYTDFDCKVMAYSAQLGMQDSARQYIAQTRYQPTVATNYQYTAKRCNRDYPSDSFSARYDYYAGDKHGSPPTLYPCDREVLGTWKHYNRSADTLNSRNSRARSPLITRELDRYYETKKRSNYMGEISMGGATDFRYYNYRRVPYFGGSDNYSYMKQRGWSRRI